MTDKAKTPRLTLAAVGDIHFSEHDQGRYEQEFKNLAGQADVLVLCGDLTQHGHASEARVLAESLKNCRVPVLGILGNHDYDKGEEQAIRDILRPVMRLLDEEAVVINEVGFTGVKGFGGGFGGYMLAAFGEQAMKDFVREAVDEALRLETDLHELETERKVVVLHYAPVPETLQGEPPEIFPFLGSSRLAEPIDMYGANLVLHGHAHHGHPVGQTLRGIPVRNVALPLLKDSAVPYAIFKV